VIWIVLLAGGGLYIVFVRYRPGAKKPLTWAEVIDAGTLNDIPHPHDVLKAFLLPDLIRPADFMANYIEVVGSASAAPPEIASKPTRSAATFEKGIGAPPGYPSWFIAAYPDVVLWLCSQDEVGMVRISAEAMYGDEGAKELIRIHGLKRIGELVEEKFEEFDAGQLRRLWKSFLRDTGKRLECAVIVAEKRPRWWRLESTSRRVPVTI
jgi:hypothetical protein